MTRRGFTLVEAMVAVGLVALVLEVVYLGQGAGARQAAQSERFTSWLQAEALVRARLEADLDALVIPPGEPPATVAPDGRSLSFRALADVPASGALTALPTRTVVWTTFPAADGAGVQLLRDGERVADEVLAEVEFIVDQRDYTYLVEVRIDLEPASGQTPRRLRLARKLEMPTAFPGLSSFLSGGP